MEFGQGTCTNTNIHVPYTCSSIMVSWELHRTGVVWVFGGVHCGAMVGRATHGAQGACMSSVCWLVDRANGLLAANLPASCLCSRKQSVR